MKYKGIFWDLDGPLYDCSQPWNVSSKTEKDLLAGRIKLTSLPNKVLSNLVPYKGLPELMKEILKENQGIISNGNYQTQVDKLKLLKLYDLVNSELIFISGGEIEKILENPTHPLYHLTLGKNKKEAFKEVQIEIAKPRAYMFEKALEKSSLDAKDCVMIGDSYGDIEGAQKVGMEDIYISGINQEPLYNPWSKKIITPNHRVQKGDIKGLKKLLLDK